MTIDDLLEVPDCSSVSQLQPIDPDHLGEDKLSSNTLILVSQRQPDGEYETKSQYLSKYATIDELDKHVEKALDIAKIKSDMADKVSRSELCTFSTLCLDNDIPYILSSFTISVGVVKSVGGYPLSDGLSIAIDDNGYIPNRLSTHIEYDSELNRIVLRNFDQTISSYIDRDEVFEDLIKSDLSNVTISKDGTKLYLHFVVKRTPESEPTFKRITVNLSAIAPYEFTDGIKTVLPADTDDSLFKAASPDDEDGGKLSVVADYPRISAAIDLSSYAKDSKLTGYITKAEVSARNGLALSAATELSTSQFVNDKHFVKMSELSGYEETEGVKKYKISLDGSNNAYVSVPWIPGSANDVSVDNVTIGKRGEDEGYEIYVKSIASLSGDLTSTMATRTDIPVKVSELENDVGYISAEYVLSVATDSDLGGFKTGYVENEKNYAVKISADQAYVTVPWTGGSAGDVAVDDVTIGKKGEDEGHKIYVKSVASLSGDLTSTMATKETVDGLIQRIEALERRLSSTSIVSLENTIYEESDGE